MSNRRSEIQEDLAIIGMTCAACSARVERALAREPGVVKANVNLAAETARVVYDPSVVDLDRLIKVVEETGYGARKLVRDASSDRQRQEKTAQAHSCLYRRCLGAPWS